MSPGTVVVMSEALKAGMRANGSSEHVAEFGECVGVVEGWMVGPSGEKWPEVDVRWEPSRLRYGYLPADLVVLDMPVPHGVRHVVARIGSRANRERLKAKRARALKVQADR